MVIDFKSEEVMSLSDKIAIANLFASSIVALCALYISALALRHTTKPRIDVNLVSNPLIRTGERTEIIFECVNVGYWYGKPPVLGLTVYCNFEPGFHLHKIAYGSVQSQYRADWKPGKSGYIYLKAAGIKLISRRQSEQLRIAVDAPQEQGVYQCIIDAHSDNGAALTKIFELCCR
jgi:hypothetical protein